MSKKSGLPKKKKGLIVPPKKGDLIASPSQVDKALGLIGAQMVRGNYAEAAAECERLLSYLPERAKQRVDVLIQLGTALGMLRDFRKSYKVLTEVLALDPNNAELWYNRSLSGSYIMRLGQALRDIERAVELNTKSELAERFAESLKFIRKIVDEELEMRGPDFTVDQLIVQENLFQGGLDLMEAEKWEEAGAAFLGTIALGDCLPQPWGNLGICFLMLERYDDAETALKRALEIDPEYTIAKNNLATLPESRRGGPPTRVVLSEPFKHSKLKQGIIFTRE